MIPKRIIQTYENHNLPMIYKIGEEIIKRKKVVIINIYFILNV